MGDLSGTEANFIASVYPFSTDDFYRLAFNKNGQEQTVFINGDYPSFSDDPRVMLCIGGSPYSPLSPVGATVGEDAAVHNVSCMVVSPDLNARRSALHTFHRATDVPNDTYLVNHYSLIDTLTASDTIRLFSVTAWRGTSRENMFSVRGDGRCSAPYGFHTQAADIAEYFTLEVPADTFKAGSVLVMDEGGVIGLSQTVADPRVLGVISTQPGYTMRYRQTSASPNDVPIAMAGTVPVFASTMNGAIEKMDLLVSGPNGHVVKASQEEKPGAVIGKALEALSKDGKKDVSAKIKMLVFNS
jgi:hypothetical protein